MELIIVVMLFAIQLVVLLLLLIWFLYLKKQNTEIKKRIRDGFSTTQNDSNEKNGYKHQLNN